MHTKQHIDLSTYQNLLRLIISSFLKYQKPLLFGAVFVFYSTAFASINLKIAVVDTGFCSSKAQVKFNTHQVLPALDMTGTNGMDCSKVSDEVLESSGRFHGQKVLNEFLSFLPKNIKVTIQPLVNYDRTGTQTELGWRNAISYIQKEKFDIVLTASGLIQGEKLVSELPGIWFVPSGRIERLVDEKTILFPQMLAPKPNLFVIGDYFDKGKILYDQGLIYQEQIDYYFPSGNKKFTGTSRAVAQAMARALDKCFKPKEVLSAHSLRLCLLSHRKTYRDAILKRDIFTY